jgi:hypothetical protein
MSHRRELAVVFAPHEVREIVSAPEDSLLGIRELRYAMTGCVILAVPA